MIAPYPPDLTAEQLAIENMKESRHGSSVAQHVCEIQQRMWWESRAMEALYLVQTRLHQELCAAILEPDGKCDCICQWADEIIKVAP